MTNARAVGDKRLEQERLGCLDRAAGRGACRSRWPAARLAGAHAGAMACGRRRSRDRRPVSRSATASAASEVVVRAAAPCRFGFEQQPRGLAGTRAVRGCRGGCRPTGRGGAGRWPGSLRRSSQHQARSARAGRRGRDGNAGPERDGPAVALRLLPDEERVVRRRAGDLDLVERERAALGVQDAAEDLFDLRLSAAGPEQLQSGSGAMPSLLPRADTFGPHQAGQRRRRVALVAGQALEAARDGKAGDPRNGGSEAFAGQPVDERAHERRPDRVRLFQQQIGWPIGAASV